MTLDADLVAINGSDWSDEPSPVWDLLERPAWHRHARCRGQWELFFPDVDHGQVPDVAAAVALCRTCPVIAECRRQGASEVGGVWAGVYISARKGRTKRRDELDPDGLPAACLAALKARNDGRWVPTSTVTAAVGRHRAPVQRALKDLALRGLVERLPSAGNAGGGGRRPDMWRWNGSEEG